MVFLSYHTSFNYELMNDSLYICTAMMPADVAAAGCPAIQPAMTARRDSRDAEMLHDN